MQLQSLFDVYKTAIFNKDLKNYLDLFDEKIHIFDAWEKWSYDDALSWKENATQWFSSLGDERVVVEFHDVQERVVADLGYATAFVTFAAVNSTGARLRFLQERLTWVVAKKGSAWKIIHAHTSFPIGHSNLKAKLQR